MGSRCCLLRRFVLAMVAMFAILAAKTTRADTGCDQAYAIYKAKAAVAGSTCDQNLVALETAVKKCQADGHFLDAAYTQLVEKCPQTAYVKLGDQACGQTCVTTGGSWEDGKCVVPDGVTGKKVSPNGCALIPIPTGPAKAFVPKCPDTDGDGYPDVPCGGKAADNCPTVANGEAETMVSHVGNQRDTDGNGIGDACQYLKEIEWRQLLVEAQKFYEGAKVASPEAAEKFGKDLRALLENGGEKEFKAFYAREYPAFVTAMMNAFVCLGRPIPQLPDFREQSDKTIVVVACKDWPFMQQIDARFIADETRIAKLEDKVASVSITPGLGALYVGGNRGVALGGVDIGVEVAPHWFVYGGPRGGVPIGIADAKSVYGGVVGLKYRFGAPTDRFRVGVGPELIWLSAIDGSYHSKANMVGPVATVDFCWRLGAASKFCVAPKGGAVNVTTATESSWRPALGGDLSIIAQWGSSSGKEDDSRNAPPSYAGGQL